MNGRIQENYNLAKEFYDGIGIDVDNVLSRLKKYSISIHCWQGDDVGGFENQNSVLSDGGIQITGNYPGKARSITELKDDLGKAFSLIPGNHRLNLHAIYGEFKNKNVDRNEIEPKHYYSWIDWAKGKDIKLDFNATLFSHPKAKNGFTLSSSDNSIREFWIEHVKRARKISAFFGSEQNSPSVHNLWIPDGFKDIPYDRWSPRLRLKESLDEIFNVDYPKNNLKDAVESKLFGIGSESFVVGSHDFYLSYALTRGKMVCLDMGHFHLTENVSDKISSILLFSDEILLHISRAVRWDSDHIPILNDDLREVATQIVRYNLDKRINIALDFFDASINRVGAYVLGARSTIKSLLIALLEPGEKIRNSEINHDYLKRLALMEESKLYPVGAVWDYYCEMNNVPIEEKWLQEVINYEKNVLSKRM